MKMSLNIINNMTHHYCTSSLLLRVALIITDDMTHHYWWCDSTLLHILTTTESLPHHYWWYDPPLLTMRFSSTVYPHCHWKCLLTSLTHDSPLLMIWFTNAANSSYCSKCPSILLIIWLTITDDVAHQYCTSSLWYDSPLLHIFTITECCPHHYWRHDLLLLYILLLKLSLNITNDMTHHYWWFDSTLLYILTITEDAPHHYWWYDSPLLIM